MDIVGIIAGIIIILAMIFAIYLYFGGLIFDMIIFILECIGDFF